MANVLVIGDGSREHAICWNLLQSPLVENIFVSPGIGITGVTNRIKDVLVDLKEFNGLAQWCRSNSVSLVVVGPEATLATGIADYLSGYDISCFGPSKAAAQLEADKKWSKEFMDKHDITTPPWKSFNNPQEAKQFVNSAVLENPFVIKAAGLAGGKGVFVTSNKEEAFQAIDQISSGKFGSAANTIIVEERLYGREASVLAFTDGNVVQLMPVFQDYKRLLDDDKGPNTGGMGAHGPLSTIDENFVQKCILQRVVDAMRAEQTPYIGVLYAGIMITDDGQIYTLEFNCRFGDPETQVILPLLESDLYQVVSACCNGILESCKLQWKKNTYCVGVVLATEGYPNLSQTTSSANNTLVFPDVNAMPNDANDSVVYFYGKSRFTENGLETKGGRIITVVARDASLHEAAVSAYRACSAINFLGKTYRRDIARGEIVRSILSNTESAYQKAGVDVKKADDMINNVKDMIECQFTADVVSAINSFGSVCNLDLPKYKRPYLVLSTDGVGTKLLVAQECGLHEGIGKDLVAMSVNDVLCQGAQPLYFLDYFASGKLSPSILQEILKGIIGACREAGCTLVGGETAEMPGLYRDSEYDVAGFAIGIVEEECMLPRTETVCDGDVLVALPSSGVHSNGLSLVRKIVENQGHSYFDIAPFGDGTTTIGQEILKPTEIYVQSMMPLIRAKKIKAMAHVTGGGLKRNIPRILPKGILAVLDAKTWRIPNIFPWLSATGNVGCEEMLNTFNCGLGAVLVVDKSYVEEVVRQANGFVCGYITTPKDDNDATMFETSNLAVRNFDEVMSKLMMPYVKRVIERRLALPARRRVAVFISGTGTNLKSLIEATKNPETNAKIVLVLSDKRSAAGLNIAKSYGIPTLLLTDLYSVSGKEQFDMLNDSISPFHVDLICLAGFMKIICEQFVRQWRGKMINIHPSLLPAFKGLHAQKQALLAGVKITGCTVHFVEPQVDSGAIIDQESVYIRKTDTFDTLTERIKEKEHIIYPRALKWLATEKILLNHQTNQVEWKH